MMNEGKHLLRNEMYPDAASIAAERDPEITTVDDVRAVSARLAEELGQTGPAVLPRLVAEYLEVREAANALDRRRKAIHEHLMTLLEDAGGAYVDEETAQRVYIDSYPRWEYDPEKLGALIAEGLITASEYAECLVTSVDKAVVQGWLDHGLVTDRQLSRVNAKVGKKVIRQIKVAPVGRKR